MADYIRYEKQVPFYGHWDVVVLGGGRPCVSSASLALKLIRIARKNPEQVFGWEREGTFDSKAPSRKYLPYSSAVIRF